MKCFTEKEQNQIINQFLTVIDICDKKRLIKDDIETCKKCKFNFGNMYMYKSLPSDIAKNICKFNYEECNKCNKLKNIVEYVDRHNIEDIDKIVEVLNEKENTEINDDINNNIFIYVNLLKYPAYGKIMERLGDGLKKYYDKEMHNEIKKYYNNLWKEQKNKTPSIESYYNKLRFRYVKEFDDNIDKYDNSRGWLIHFIMCKFSFIECIVNKILDIIIDSSLNSLSFLLVKSNIITLNIRYMMSRFTDVDKDGFLSKDFQQYLDNRFPYVHNKQKIIQNKIKQPSINYLDYLKDASDFD